MPTVARVTARTSTATRRPKYRLTRVLYQDGTWADVPVRPRWIEDDEHARHVRAFGETARHLLPRYGVNSPIRDHGPNPGQFTGTIAWTTRAHFLRHIVPLAMRESAKILARHRVAECTFMDWAHHKTLYAETGTAGRRVVVRPDTLAELMGCTVRTVQRCNAAAREMGVELVITPGRMLSEIECRSARNNGSPQRGHATVTAFVVPPSLHQAVRRAARRAREASDRLVQLRDGIRHVVDHVTPTRGPFFNASDPDCLTLNHRAAGINGAPLRSAPAPSKEVADDLLGFGVTPRTSPAPQNKPQDPSSEPAVSPDRPGPIRGDRGRYAHSPTRRPPRSPSAAPKRRMRGPSWYLAKDLCDRVLFLRHCPPGRLANQLSRYLRPDTTQGLTWSAEQLARSMDHINQRLGYTSVVKAKIAPWALLAWYLRQIDPYSDHPHAGANFPQAEAHGDHSPPAEIVPPSEAPALPPQQALARVIDLRAELRRHRR